MNGDHDKALREQLIQTLRGGESHLSFHDALNDFPLALVGVKAEGSPHTAWQLLEHMRIALHDILEFSRNPNHKSPKWPDEYWPKTDTPLDKREWELTVAAFQKWQQEMENLISDPTQDLFKPIEGGTGQTLLREALVAAAHNSYHLGQLVLLKRELLAKS